MRAGDRPQHLREVALIGQEGTFDLTLGDGRVTDITPSVAARPNLLVLPAFADMHLHADRAYQKPRVRPAGLEEAIALTTELRRNVSADDVRQRAGLLLERALSHGTLWARSHIDIDEVVDDRSLDGALAVKDDLRGRLDLEIVAFATSRSDPATREGEARLRWALARGADLIGGVVSLYSDPAASSESLLDLASETGMPLDLHVDETVRTPRTWIDHLARGAVERGLKGRLTVSHACVLSSLEEGRAQAAIEALAEAQATVVALPATNLYLQDRGDGTPRRRGFTLVRELMAAGVPVRFGSDNVADAFYPYGDADPLETAFLASLVGHIDDDSTLLAGISNGRTGLVAGEPADLVLVEAASFTEALARRPPNRVVLRGGVVVSGFESHRSSPKSAPNP